MMLPPQLIVQPMASLLIIAHTPMASALQAVAQHAFPDCAQHLKALDVLPGMGPDEVERLATEILASMGEREALIFTDVFGATPCNAAQRLADGMQVKVIAGVNVPMLWRSLCYANEPLEALAARAVAGATQGVMQVAVSRPQNQAHQPGANANDQNQHHHQQ
jgi:mannose PTS system EIIA component